MKSPTNIELSAISWGQQISKRLVRFSEIGPNRGGRGISGTAMGEPVTDVGYWEGRWVLCPLRIESESGDGMTIADAVTAVNREHRIVSTALTGRDGTVKEYVNAGDWNVSFVLGLQHVEGGEIKDEWPGDEVRELRKLLERKEALRVYSEFLDAMNIGRIVIRSYLLRQMTEGNYQVVEVSAVSDEDYEIFSNDYEQPKKESTR